MILPPPSVKIKTGMAIPNPTNRYRKRCHYCQKTGDDRFQFTKHGGAFMSFICYKCLVEREYEYAQWIGEKLPTYEDVNDRL